MDALIPAFLLAALSEVGDRSPWLAAMLAARFGARPVILGAIFATVVGCTISATFGALLQPLLGTDARLLFLGMALVITGLIALFPRGAPDMLAGWRIGGFATSALGLMILQFGEGSQFLVTALAANARLPATAAIGAMFGTLIVIVPMTLAGVALRDRMPLRLMRIGPALLFLAAGLIAAVNALGIA